MEEKVLEIIRKYNLIESGDRIVVGVSGGPDSICLLNVLNNIRKNEKNNLKYELFVCHINHMIRANAILDEEFVEEYCKKNEIPIFIKRADILNKAKTEKMGTEETGRIVRYSFFEEILKQVGANKIATAHNNNDNAETVIMNIVRGSSINGLKGIERKRGIFIRPLIDIQREEIEEYCKEQNLNPRHDESNDENVYNRNKVRNIIIPYIKEEFNPNIVETINRLSSLATEESQYLEEEAENRYKEIVQEESKQEIILNLQNFNKLELVIKRRVIIYTINRLLKTTNGIEKIHIEDIIKLCGNNIGNKFLTPNKNIKVLVKNRKIFFQKL